MAAYELLVHPTWVFDIEERTVVWGNEAAVRMWRADDLDAMLERDYSDMSESAVRRVMDNLHRCLRGEHVIERWTFYPNDGEPQVVDCAFGAIHLSDGRPALLIQGTLPSAPDIDSENQRGIEALRHLPMAVCQFDTTGQLVSQNPMAAGIFGPLDSQQDSLLSRFADAEEGARIVDAVRAGEVVHTQARLCTVDRVRWFYLELRLGRDPVNGEPLFLFVANDISELKETEAELTRARDEAQSAARMKSEFLAMISHEIRTPLHGIVGCVELLGDTALDREQSGYLNSMDTSARLLLRLINDVLDLSKIEVGNMQLESLDFELESVVKRSCAAIAPRIAEKELQLTVDISNRVPSWLNGDPLRIEQILINLLGNAVKFTNQGRVIVRVRMGYEGGPVDSGSRIRIEIEDTGIGIPAERIDSLFDKFTQVDISISRRFGGTGLGLAICKLLVALMGGEIGVESVQGKGTCFWVELPLLAGHGRSAAAVDDAWPVAEQCLRILVADDNRLNQRVAVAMLEKIGHQVTVAEDGAEAVALVERERFDVILMDVQMPTMDGLEATRLIRGKGLSRQVLPIIGLTASAVHDNRELYIEAGMNDCITKPFRIGQLAAVLVRGDG